MKNEFKYKLFLSGFKGKDFMERITDKVSDHVEKRIQSKENDFSDELQKQKQSFKIIQNVIERKATSVPFVVSLTSLTEHVVLLTLHI